MIVGDPIIPPVGNSESKMLYQGIVDGWRNEIIGLKEQIVLNK